VVLVASGSDVAKENASLEFGRRERTTGAHCAQADTIVEQDDLTVCAIST
jgi:hypothetical protein